MNYVPKMVVPAVEAGLSLDEELRRLLLAFELYLHERSRSRPIGVLCQAVDNLRLQISRFLVEHFFKFPLEREDYFIATLACLLAERGKQFVDSEEDGEYVELCIEEVVKAFEYAKEIKLHFPHDIAMQRILAYDIPVLQPFDFGLRQKLHLVKEVTDSLR